MSQSQQAGYFGQRLIGVGLWLLLALVGSLTGAWAAGDARIEAARLKPEVLYIDLANPATARGLELADEKQAANLKRTEIDGVAAGEPEDGWVTLKLDPERVKRDTPLLVAFSYYDAERWDEPKLVGFPHTAARPQDGPVSLHWENCYTRGGAYSDSWRWWTAFTYANYGRGQQASFRLGAHSLGWVLVLPLDDAARSEMNGVREKVLALYADYSRLVAAENALQLARGRLEQALRHLQASSPQAAVPEAIGTVRTGAGQARVEMDRVILEVLAAVDPAYLGLYDGQMAPHLQGLEAFGQKVRELTARYRALTAQAEQYLSQQVAAQSKQYRLKQYVGQPPAQFTAGHVITPRDLRNRFLFGLVMQLPLLNLPPDSLKSINSDQGIASVYDYSVVMQVVPKEDGPYDFSYLDRTLGRPGGLRVEMGIHNIPIPGGFASNARPSFYGEEIKPGHKERDTVFRYGGFRVKAKDGNWDGYYAWNGNDSSFCPASGAAVWSDTLINYTHDFLRAVGAHYRNDPRILRYVLNGEGGAGAVLTAGYVYDAALPYYRRHLQEKFKTLEALNRALGTTYGSFEEIKLPEPAPGEQMVRLTPAYYEYVQLCVDRTKAARESSARVLREADPNHAIGDVQSSMYGGYTIDTYSLVANSPWDTFSAGDSDTRTVRYQYSLNRYNPRPIWMYEPYVYTPWGAPEGKGYRIEETSRRMLTANLWTWFFWGHQGIPFFNSRQPDMVGGIRSDGSDYRLADIVMGPAQGLRTTNPVLRLAAGCTAPLKATYESLLPVLHSAPVVPARIGLLESATTHKVPYPASGTFQDVGQLQGRLGSEGRHFWFVPEGALIDGKEPLSEYRLIIAAYATHLRPEARQALLNWVRQGGTLIGSGPTGLFDHLGRTEGGIPEVVFGMKGVEYGAGITEDSKVASASGSMAGREGMALFSNKDFYWRLPATGLAQGTRILAALGDGSPLVVEADYGKGKVILTASTIGSLADVYWPMVRAELSHVQPVPEASSSVGGLMLQVRESRDGVRYLSAVNRNVSAAVESVITVAGEYERPRDLTVGGGWVIPSQASGGVTRFTLWLEPGMGSLIELGKSRVKLTGLSPEAESAQMALGQFANLLRSATAWGLEVTAEQRQLQGVEASFRAGRFPQVRRSLTQLTSALGERWFDARATQVDRQAQRTDINPLAATWARSYAAIARQYFTEGKLETAEARMNQAESTLKLTPQAYPAQVTAPFVSGQLDLQDLASWPQTGWQTVYRDRQTKTDELGQFILVGSPAGLYIGAKVKKQGVVATAQKPGLPWRVMDAVVLNFRGLDVTEELSNEFRTDDSYEITFYPDGSVFVWDNLLPSDTKLIRNHAQLTAEGYQIGGFIPAEAVRFWPRPGVNIIADVCLFSFGQQGNNEGYWHGTYGQAQTWARVRLGQTPPPVAGASPAETQALPPNTAQACLRVEHWSFQEARGGGVGRAAIAFDPNETLPQGKRGAIVLSNEGPEESAQLMTMFPEIGTKPGLRVWLKGSGSGAEIELRVTGREGYTWQKLLKDESAEWRAVEVVLDQCVKTREEVHFEVLSGYQDFRPRLNRLIVRLARPLEKLKIGLVEYLP